MVESYFPSFPTKPKKKTDDVVEKVIQIVNNSQK